MVMVLYCIVLYCIVLLLTITLSFVSIPLSPAILVVNVHTINVDE